MDPVVFIQKSFISLIIAPLHDVFSLAAVNIFFSPGFQQFYDLPRCGLIFIYPVRCSHGPLEAVAWCFALVLVLRLYTMGQWKPLKAFEQGTYIITFVINNNGRHDS